MTEEFVLNLGREALLTVLLVGGPVLGLGLLTGLLVSIFQATTQINEQTLTFIPKIVVVLISVVIFGPWMFNAMMEFTNNVYAAIPDIGR